MADSGGFSVNETQDPAYFSILNQIRSGDPYDWSWNRANNTLNQYGNDFYQQFQNAVGRAPTSDEINQFYAQAVQPIMYTPAGFNSTDPYSVVQQYIPQAYQSQIQQNQQNQANQQIQNLQNQQQQALQSNLQTIEGQVPQIASNVSQSFMNGPGYQALLGQLNNNGILNSGATSAAVGNTIGNDISSNVSNLISGLVGNATSQMQQNPTNAFNLAQSNTGGLVNQGGQAEGAMNSYNQQLNDFNLEAQLAKQMADMQQPSGFATDLGYANAASGALSNLVGAGSKAAYATNPNGTSYICIEMMNRGLLCEQDLDDLHYHVASAVFKKGRAFWEYTRRAQSLVAAANRKEINWQVFKPLFFDRVMAEPDPVKAVNLYVDAFRQLCEIAAPQLWDERVMRVSVVDSIPFWPLLLTYKPYIRVLRKVLTRKMAFVYDKPRCWRHYGA